MQQPREVSRAVDGTTFRSFARACLTLLAVVGASAVHSAYGGIQVLESRKTQTPPKLDGAITDAAWSEAKPILVAVTQPMIANSPGDTIVELRAVHTDRDLYIAIRWRDTTHSIHKDRWTFDGSRWSRDREQDEDRLALIFPIDNSVPWFPQGGCVLACHSVTTGTSFETAEIKWYMATLGPTERFDAWHWKAVRTNPVGYMDDKFWNHDLPGPGRKNAGRHYDPRLPGPSPAAGNVGRGGKQPAFMQDPSRPPSLPGVLARDEIVPFDGSRFKAGDTVPGRILSRPVGSQADIRCAGVWRDGQWRLEIQRALNTGHDDDVVFKPGQRVPFALAVFNNVPEYRKQDHGKAVDLLWLWLREE